MGDDHTNPQVGQETAEQVEERHGVGAARDANHQTIARGEQAMSLAEGEDGFFKGVHSAWMEERGMFVFRLEASVDLKAAWPLPVVQK
jgi:hypothetical protein